MIDRETGSVNRKVLEFRHKALPSFHEFRLSIPVDRPIL